MGLGLLLSGAMVNATKLQPAEDLPGLKAIKIPNSPQISPRMPKACFRSHFQGIVGWNLRLTDTLGIVLGPKTTSAPSSCVCTKLQTLETQAPSQAPHPRRRRDQNSTEFNKN